MTSPEPRATGSAHSAFPFFLLIFAALAFKAPDALTSPQFWAEDAAVFFKEQYALAFPQILVQYSGYLHIVPRLVAWVASIGSTEKAPLIYNAIGIICSAAALAYTAGRMRGVVPMPLAIASFLLVPTSGEILGSVTNLQWFLQIALAAACITSDRRTAGRWPWLRASCVLLMALTGPFSVILAIVASVLLLMSWIARRFGLTFFDGELAQWGSYRDLYVLVAVMIGAVIQITFLMDYHSEEATTHIKLLKLLSICFLDLVPIHAFGSDFLGNDAWLILYLAMLGAIAFGRHLSGKSRLIILAMVAYAAAETFAPMHLKSVTNMYSFAYADRYFFITKIVFWWAIYAAMVASGQAKSRTAASTVTVLIVLVALVNTDHLRRAPLQDFQWRSHAAELKLPGQHQVPVNPAGWIIQVETPAPSQPQ